ncbi:MAG: CPBP family intramembrane metalloprotease [Oscillospiraceae bacterium]|nr:CPBP family intramembrane metalloprotease [Oscillospiraceae bacterium]
MAQEIINVVEDFDYDSRNEEYNSSFRKWRASSPSKFAYRYADDTRERSYVAGKAVTKPSAASVERKTLARVSEAAGVALLLYFISEVAGGSLLTYIFRLLNLNVHLDFLTLSMNGSQLAVAGVRTLTLLLKFGIPICVMIACFRLPRKVMLPQNISALPETVFAVGFAMVCSAVYALIGHAQGVEEAQAIFTYKDTFVIASYSIADAVIASILAEIFLRGLLLPVLRQFGDLYAICVTAFCAFMFPGTLPSRIAELMIGMGAGYLMLRGGSLWKCVLLRFLFTVLNFARLIVIYSTYLVPRWQYVMILLLTGVGLIFFYMRVRKSHLLLSNRRTQLSNRRKLSAFMQTVTVLPWAAISTLMLLLQLFF